MRYPRSMPFSYWYQLYYMSTKELHCTHCSQTFSRPSHLHRHAQSHLHRSKRDLRLCPHCGRRFARNDILIRHLRSFHSDYVHCARASQKSCFRCVQKKTRCNRGHPCHQCVKAEVDCQYPQDIDSRISLSESHQPELIPPTSPPAGPEERELVQTDLLDDGANSIPQAGLSTSSSLALGRWFNDPLAQTGPPSNERNSMVAQGSPLCATESMDITLTRSCRSDTIGPFLSPDVTFGFGLSDLDWLDVDFSQFDLNQWHTSTSHEANTTVVTTCPPTLTAMQCSADIPGYQSTDVSPAVITSPIQTDKNGNGNGNGNESRPSGRVAPTHQWPFDDDCQNPTLPQLESLVGRGAMSQPALGRMPPSATAPNRQVLDAYFNHFHEILPLMHVPSFDTATCPPILVAAMSTVGAMFEHKNSTCKDSWPYSVAYLQLLSSCVSL